MKENSSGDIKITLSSLTIFSQLALADKLILANYINCVSIITLEISY